MTARLTSEATRLLCLGCFFVVVIMSFRYRPRDREEARAEFLLAIAAHGSALEKGDAEALRDRAPTEPTDRRDRLFLLAASRASLTPARAAAAIAIAWMDCHRRRLPRGVQLRAGICASVTSQGPIPTSWPTSSIAILAKTSAT
jgi:hypothetical protein